jgi:glycosyltransferase involved in cell wall biosynthesis
VKPARYRLATLELTQPIRGMALAEDENGVGLTLRLDDQPIAFLLRELPYGATLQPDGVAALLGKAEAVALLAERIRRELLAGAAGTAPADAPQPSAVPSVTAVVCTRDRPQLLARCLESLVAVRGHVDAGAPRLEILVVDNAPADARTRDTALRFAGVRYVLEPTPGLDFARNRALAACDTDFVAYFDDDVTVDPAWLAGFVETWSAHPDLAAVTGPVLPLELATPAQIEFERLGGFRHVFERIRFGTTQPGNDLYPHGPGIFGVGCNMAFRRDALLGIGGFDEALDTGPQLPGGGDLDIFYRLVRAGHVIVSAPRCLVLHQHRRTYAQLRHQMWTWGLGFMAYVAKSYRAEPAERAKFRRLIAWWLERTARLLARRMRGRAAPPTDLVLAELAGGVRGICGEYGRSRRRIEGLRRLTPSQSHASGE